MLAYCVLYAKSFVIWYNKYMKESRCFFCDKVATHFDVVMKDSEYIVADVCNGHLVMGLSS